MMLTEAKAMTQSERLQAMEELWDIICHDDTALEVPKWHKNILAERREMMRSGKAKFITIEDLKAASH
ncbi:MAG: addiction module protein [Mariprofundus sp.]|nr:addiction module protein [Mariprofundus sp.]